MDNQWKKNSDKRMSLTEAIGTFVRNGDAIAFGGMGGSQCVAHTYEIIRQKISDLTLIGDSNCESGDMLMGAGLLKRAEIAWCAYAVAGLGSNYRRIVEKKIPHPMELVEYSNYGIGLRFLAGAMNLPFLPTRSFMGSDLMTFNPNIKIMNDPYGNEKIALVPAANPNVAMIHCNKADKRGNTQILGFSSNAENVARAAKHAIITCERIVSTDEIRQNPNLTTIPEYVVDAVVEVPYACHPWNFPYEYIYDIPFHTKQMEAFKTREGFLEWLDEWCYGTDGWEGYLRKVGFDRLDKLSRTERKFTKQYC